LHIELFIEAINSVLDKFLDGGRFHWKINGILSMFGVEKYCNFILRLVESLERVGNKALLSGLREKGLRVFHNS